MLIKKIPYVLCVSGALLLTTSVAHSYVAPENRSMHKAAVLHTALDDQWLSLAKRCLQTWQKSQDSGLNPCQRARLHRTLSWMIFRLKDVLPEQYKIALIALSLDEPTDTLRNMGHAEITLDPEVTEFCRIFL